MALGDEERDLELYVEDIRSSAIPYSGGHVKNQNIEKVKQTNIDVYFEKQGIKKIDLILLDIEGFEWFALNGAKKILGGKPNLILEISPRILKHTNITPEMMFNHLLSMAYELHFIDDYQKKFLLVQDSQDARKHFLKRDYVNIYAKSR